MPATWPAGVRRSFASDMRFGAPQDTFLVTPFDKGTPARRRNTLASPRSVSLRIPYLPRAELAVFEDWFEDVLGGGALAFEMPHPLTGAVRTWAFEPGAPYETLRVNNRTVSLSLSLSLYPAI